ncbi:MAG TPA: Ig-like domain-containing protein [Longimicrobiales bacterium]
MRSSRWARVAVACAAVAGIIVACVDQDSFLGPGRDARLALVPQFAELPSAGGAPIVRIRLTATDAGGAALGAVDTAGLDPNAPSWAIDLPVDLSGGPAAVTVTVELLDAAGVVEWSGRMGPFELSPGTGNPPPIDVPVGRGPLDNLDVTAVTITTADTTLNQGDSLQLGATIEGGGEGSVVFWSTSDPTRATVSATGVVTALLPDSAEVYAAAGMHADTFRLRIRPPSAAASVVIDAFSPDTLHTLAQSIQLAATAFDEQGAGIPSAVIAWTSLDGAVAGVSGSGLVSPIMTGTARIVATSGAAADTVQVTVDQVPLTVAVTPPADTTSVTGSVGFAASAQDSAGFAVAGATFTWTSSNESVATVAADGRATGVAAGTTTITATHRGVSGSAALLVVDANPAPACADPPLSSHGGRIVASETWTAAGSPHLLSATVDVDSGAVLTIEPGAVVCGASYAYLQFVNGARLDARGTAADPIVFSAADTAQPWGGVYLEGDPADSSRIAHATIEYTAYVNGAVYAGSLHPAVVEDATVQHVVNAALYLQSSGSVVRNVVVSDARTTGYYAVIVGGTNTVVEDLAISDVAGTGFYPYGTNMTLARIGVVRAGQDGVYLSGTGHVLSDLRIQDAGAIGLNSGSSGDHLASATNVRVTGSGSYGFRSGIGDLALIAPTVADQDSLLGNARDTLAVVGGQLRGRTQDVRADVPWLIESTIYVDSASLLRVQPGAYVFGAPFGHVYLTNGGSLDARGTSAQPITFTSDSTSPWYGITGSSSVADTSWISNALIEFSRNTGALEAYGQHAMVIDSVRVRQATYSGVVLHSPGSRLRHSTIDTTHTPAYAAVTLANDVTFDGNVVRGAAGRGISVVGGDVRILGGRIEDSGDLGIDFSSGYRLAEGGPVRVIGSPAHPARLSLSALARMYPDATAQDSLLGNGADTLIVVGGSSWGDTATATAALPWRVESSVYFDSTSTLYALPGSRLSMQPGAYVEFRTGSSIQAIGSAAQPVTFTSLTAGNYWGGLYFSEAPADTSRIRHALIEYGGSGGYAGVFATNAHVVRVDSTRIRQSYYRGVYLAASASSLRGVVVDTTSIPGYPAVELYSNTSFIASTIRGAAGIGLQLNGTGVLVQGGRIEGSADVGMHAGSSQTLAAGSLPPRITGGATYPLRIAIQPFGMLFPTTSAQDSIVGNGAEGVAITGGVLEKDTTWVRADLPWRVEGTTYFDSTSVLHVQPGATVALEAGRYLEFRSGGTLQALGSAAQPITFTSTVPGTYWGGLYFVNAAPDTSRITHALIEHGGSGGYAGIFTNSPHVVRVENTRIRQSQYRGAYVAGAGSSLRGVVIDTTSVGGYDGLEVTADVALDGVTVRGAAGNGVRYSGSPSTPLRMNVYGSGSFAAEMSPAAVWRLGEIEDDTLTGNAIDRIRVTGGTVVGGTRYLRATLPWQLAGAVYLDSAAALIADSGSVVYAETGSLNFRSGSRFEANGTATQPVVFTTTDGTNRWNGLRFYDTPADTSVLLHTRVEYAQDGNSGAIYTDASHVIRLDTVTVTRSTYRALTIASSGSLVRATLVDTTTTPGYVAAWFDDTVNVDGLTVRAAASQGFEHAGEPSAPMRVNVYGAGGLAGEVTATAAARLTEVEDDTLTGNAINRVRLSGGTVSGLAIHMRPSLPFGLTGNVIVDAGAALVAYPGSSLHADNGYVTFQNGGYIDASGTSAQPILFTSATGANTWTGLRFYNAGAATSVLRNVNVEYVQDGNSGAIYADASHVMLLDTVTIERSTYRALTVLASGSIIRETLVDTTLTASGYIAAYFDNDVELDGLTVRAAASQGFEHVGAPTSPLRVSVLDAGGLAGQASVTAAARITEIDDDVFTGSAANWLRLSGSTLTGLTLRMRPSVPLGLNGGVVIGVGASMVGEPGATLHADGGTLSFNSGGYASLIGAAGNPIVFTTTDGTNRWNGLRFNNAGATTSVLRHVRVEYAQDGNTGAIYGDASHVLLVDSSSVIRSTYTGLAINASGSLVRDVLVDTTLSSSGYIAARFTNDVGLDGLTVRAAANQGFDHAGAPTTPLRVTVVDAAGLAGEVTPTAAARLTQIEDDSVGGNAVNRVRISGGTVTGLPIYMRPSLPLGLNGTAAIDAGASVIALPGGSLRADAGTFTFQNGGYMNAVGAVGNPVVFTSSDGTNRWSGLRFNGTPADTSRLRHVRVEYAQDGNTGAISGIATHPVALDSVVVERATYSAIQLAAGSLNDVTVDTTVATSGYNAIEVNGALTLRRVRVRAAGANAIRTNVGGVTISECEITGSGGSGVYVPNNPSTVSVNFCDLVGNANNAVHSVQNTAGIVNAANNYWGGSAPAQDSPNGVSAGVSYDAFATTPYGYVFPQ